MEQLVSSFQAIYFICFLGITFILLFIAKGRSSRLSIVFIGLALIVWSAYYSYLLTDLDKFLVIISKENGSGNQGEFIKSYSLNREIFLFVFPFISAAIGSNLISDAITGTLKYNKS